MMIIIRHIETQLNYRTTVSLRSDFLHINGFPEVYHGGEISAAVVTPGWTWPDTQWKTAVKSPSFLNIGHKTVSFHGNFRGAYLKIRNHQKSDPGVQRKELMPE